MEETTEKSGLAVLGINPVNLLLQLATFLLLFALLKKYAFKPIVSMLEQRRKTINDGIKLGREMEAEREKLKTEVETALHKARLEADKIITNAQREAGEIEKAAEESAQRKVEALLNDAEAKIASATTQAKRQLLEEARVLIAEATSVLIREKIDPSKDSALLHRALEEAKR